MALTPCRECGKEISDQAESCPNCGIKNPGGLKIATAPAAGTVSDEKVLQLGNVTITSTLAKFQNQTFPINGIGSVTLVPPKNAGLFIAGIVCGLIGFFGVTNDAGGAGLFFLVVAFAFIGAAFTRKHGLVIKTASGDVRAMESEDEKVLAKVKEAIERAATMRG